MILHTINKSPFQHDTLASCLRVSGKEDALLLMEDGVYAAVDGSTRSELLTTALGQMKVYALVPDLQARGLDGKLIDGVQTVDYDGFVELTEQCQSIMSWF